MSPRSLLLEWYDAHARDLPWRRTRDPYAIWVSEVMLQQTRVDTVLGYFGHFLDRFPTPAALAAATEDEVMAAWSGLGYYRRARLLHQGVREVVARYGGRVPEARDARLSLPGVGPYTAGALGSIAFGRPEPLVDGNVARVLSRLRAVDTPVGRAETERRLYQCAARLVQGPRPGDLNQALMELGATVCKPINPGCDRCPLRRGCVARRTGRVAELPVLPARRRPLRVKLVALHATRADGAVFFVRAEGSLFGGLYGLPTMEGQGVTRARCLLEATGLEAQLSNRAAGRVQHTLTHRQLDVQVFSATAARPMPRSQARALRPAALNRVGISTLTKKLMAVLGGRGLEGDAPTRSGSRRAGKRPR